MISKIKKTLAKIEELEILNLVMGELTAKETVKLQKKRSKLSRLIKKL